jgi:hypothetical protein
MSDRRKTAAVAWLTLATGLMAGALAYVITTLGIEDRTLSWQVIATWIAAFASLAVSVALFLKARRV